VVLVQFNSLSSPHPSLVCCEDIDVTKLSALLVYDGFITLIFVILFFGYQTNQVTCVFRLHFNTLPQCIARKNLSFLLQRVVFFVFGEVHCENDKNFPYRSADAD